MTDQSDKKFNQCSAGSGRITRRDFVVGAASGLGACGPAVASPEAAAGESHWDNEADVVVCGVGAVGLVCAIRARDLGNRVIVVDGNFDVGGKMPHRGGGVSRGAAPTLISARHGTVNP